MSWMLFSAFISVGFCTVSLCNSVHSWNPALGISKQYISGSLAFMFVSPHVSLCYEYSFFCVLKECYGVVACYGYLDHIASTITMPVSGSSLIFILPASLRALMYSSIVRLLTPNW